MDQQADLDMNHEVAVHRISGKLLSPFQQAVKQAYPRPVITSTSTRLHDSIEAAGMQRCSSSSDVIPATGGTLQSEGCTLSVCNLTPGSTGAKSCIPADIQDAVAGLLELSNRTSAGPAQPARAQPCLLFCQDTATLLPRP